MIEQPYNLALVILSVVIATIGAYVAIEIAQHVRDSGDRRRVLWSTGGALALGLAIWSMHFTGMEGMRTSVAISYDPRVVAASIAVAIIVSFAALALTRNLIETGPTKRAPLKKAAASLLMGSAVAGMHYTGMAAAH